MKDTRWRTWEIIGLFWTLAAGNLLVLAVTALTALLGGLALTPALLTWFVVATLLDLIFLALGTLCAMVTGWLLAVPVLYAAVNCLAVALTWLGQQLADGRLRGVLLQYEYHNGSLPVL